MQLRKKTFTNRAGFVTGVANPRDQKHFLYQAAIVLFIAVKFTF